MTQYRIERLPGGAVRRRVTAPGGGVTETVSHPDRRQTSTLPDGTTSAAAYGGDPRFGMQAPMLQSLTVTTPGGKADVITATRAVRLRDDNDLFSLEELRDTYTVNGRVFTSVYDGAARTLTGTSPEGRQVVTTLDAAGRTVQFAPGAGLAPLTYTYDDRGRMVGAAQGTHAMTLARGADGLVTSRTDALGQTTAYTHDAAGRLASVARDGRTFSLSRDPAGALTAVQLPSGQQHTTTYTAAGDMASFTAPGDAAYQAAYDLDGLRTQTTLPSGAVTATTYDGAGRPTHETDPDGEFAYTYQASNLTDRIDAVTRTLGSGASDALGFAFDGSLVTGRTLSGSVAGELTYTHDDRFLPTNIRLVSGADDIDIPMTWDGDGLLTGLDRTR